MNGPHVIRKDLPEDLKEEVIQHNLNLQKEDQKCFKEITMGESQGFIPVTLKVVDEKTLNISSTYLGNSPL